MEGRRLSARRLLAMYRRGDRSFRHVAIDPPDLEGAVLEGVDLWGGSLPEARLRRARLAGSSLQRADLSSADLRGADLRDANLWGARLDRAQLQQADLRGARLEAVNLIGASLEGADLRGASLTNANLSNTDLRSTRWARAELRDIRLQGANLEGASLVDLTLPPELGEASNLEGATVDWRAVARSLHHPALIEVLSRTGMPKLASTYLVDALHAMDAVDLATMVKSVFLVHDPSNAERASALRQDLTEQGMRAWHRPAASSEGALRGYDVMLLVCSRALLLRPRVLQQLQALLRPEQPAQAPPRVLAVQFDDVLDNPGAPPLDWPNAFTPVYRDLRQCVVADLRAAAPGSPLWWGEVAKIVAAFKTP